MLEHLLGTVIANKYRVDELIGVGGMAVVFRGYHLDLHRAVAIKVLHPELSHDDTISKRFDREARSASRLDHPNCVRVYDYGSTADGMKYMVMELLHGTELSKMLGRPYKPRRALKMISQIYKALEHAHEYGVVHRDIKPDNISVIRDHDGRETIKIVDFGIAKIVSGHGAGDSMTTGRVVGTPQYMSPEQAMGAEIDERSDLYSAGVIFYEMLAGRPPFEADDPMAVATQHVHKDPPPLPSTVPHPVVVLVHKLLHKEREARYPDARTVRLHVEALGKHPTLTEPGTSRFPVVKKKRMSWTMAISVSLITSVVVYMFVLPHLPRVPWGKYASTGVHAQDNGKAPNLMGITVADAQQQVWERGIVILRIGEEERPNAASGTILSQTPEAGQIVSEKQIRVVVAKKPSQVEVPELTGKAKLSAREELVEAGFSVPTAIEEGSTQPEGTVIRLEPPPGAKLAPGAEVQLFVSIPRIKVPDLRRKNAFKVKSLLEEAGLTLGKRTEVQHAEHYHGYILSQKPAAGEMVEPATKIDFRVVAP